jgi:tetratricopeptide (TPR) repeat protein
MRLLLLGLSAALIAGYLLLASRAEPEAWTGKWVMPKHGDTQILVDADGGKRPADKPRNALAKVLNEKDEWLHVVTPEWIECWLQKSEAVPLTDAIRFFTNQIRRNAKNARAYNMRAVALEQMGETEKALKDYGRAIELEPGVAIWYFNRGRAHHMHKAYDDAISDYSIAIELDPKYAWAYYNRGLAYYDTRTYGSAISDYFRAIELDPKHSWAHNNLAWIWVTCPDAKYRDGQKAIEYAQKACALSGHKAANHLSTLAAAYAEVGQFKQAVSWMQKAVDLANDSSKEEVEEVTRILKLYKAGKPYRNE